MPLDLARIGRAIRLGRWAMSHLGYRVAVHEGRSYRSVTRLGNMKPAMAIAALPLLGACMLGMPVRRFAPAGGPQGVTADLRLTNDVQIQGELLAAGDTALVIRQTGIATIAVVRYSSLRNGQFPQVMDVWFFGAPDPATLGRLRRVSRFPQGLTPELMQRLLEAHNQREPSIY